MMAMMMMMKTLCRAVRKAAASKAGTSKISLRAKWVRIAAIFLLPTSLLAEPVSLKRVVELALTHATGAGITAADEAHAAAGYAVQVSDTPTDSRSRWRDRRRLCST